MNPQLITVENPQDLPILVIDKKGAIGEALCEKLSAEFLTIFVNGREKKAGHNIIRVPYRHKIPNIPDNLFSYIFIISEDESEAYSHVKTLLPKAKANNAHIVVILPSALVHDKFLIKLQYLYPEAMIVLYGDLFGWKEHLSLVDEFIEDAGTSARVSISKSGVEKSYPIQFSDAVAGIIRAVFSQFHQGEIFLLMPNFFVSDVSLTRMLQKELSELQTIISRRGRAQSKYCIPKRGIYIYPAYPIEEKIKESVRQYQGIKRITRQLQEHTPSQLKRFVGYTKVGLWVGTVFVLLVGFLGGISYLGISRMAAGNSAGSSRGFLHSDVSLRFAEQLLSDMEPVAKVVGLGGQITSAQSSLSSAMRLSQLEKQFTRVKEDLQTLGKGELKEEQIENIRVEMKDLLTMYAGLTKEEKDKLKEQGAMEKGIASLTSFGSLIDFLPQFVGKSSKKTYLVLFTDNTELRGSGGVVETHGLLTVNKGRIESFVIKDTNELDITLKDTITPPAMLQKYVGTEQLFLKDSLYAADFPTGAAQANLLHYLATQQRVDGVIAVDMTFLSELLNFKKGSQITGVGSPLTPEVFTKRIQSDIADKSLPATPEKKEQLQKIYKALESVFTSSFADDPFGMFAFLHSMAERRHISLFSEDPSLENNFLATNMTQTTKERRVKRQGSFADMVSVVDSNVGQNNANYYVKRSYDHKITLLPSGGEDGVLAVRYENKSPANDVFGGIYKAYVQLVLPRKATVTDISIDGEVQVIRSSGTPAPVVRRGRVATPSLEVATFEEGERSYVGFYLELEPGLAKTITLAYSLPQVVAFNSGSFVYNYLFAKQAGGRDDESLRVGIDYPQTFSVKQVPDTAKEVDTQVVYEGTTKTDNAFQIVFSQK